MTAAVPGRVVLTTQLFGLPCSVCGFPSDSMDTVGQWTRIRHQFKVCDIGEPPAGGRHAKAVTT